RRYVCGRAGGQPERGLRQLVLIQRGDRHEIVNTGRSTLRTLNIYVPPAYTYDGDELPPAKA
ncbi:MAG: hypothetical protein J0H36_08385, partial [Hyphomicrobium denitrificans]|nr:hypothetical protein [Hyphomicrobium denitrificans]